MQKFYKYLIFFACTLAGLSTRLVMLPTGCPQFRWHGKRVAGTQDRGDPSRCDVIIKY